MAIAPKRSGASRGLDRELHDFEQRFARALTRLGHIFRDRAELSAFGAQIEDYACVYTNQVSNFRYSRGGISARPAIAWREARLWSAEE